PLRPQSGIASAIDRVFGGHDALGDEAGNRLPAKPDDLFDEPGAFPPAGGDVPLGGQASPLLFGGDRATPSHRASDRVFSGEGGVLAEEGSGLKASGIGAAAALLGAGYFLGDRRQNREEEKSQPQRRRS